METTPGSAGWSGKSWRILALKNRKIHEDFPNDPIGVGSILRPEECYLLLTGVKGHLEWRGDFAEEDWKRLRASYFESLLSGSYLFFS